MECKILIAGFGGQGMMILGKMLAKAAIIEGKYATFIPSYGAEMRGGTAHCIVKIADSSIASPFIDHPDVAIILNQPSLAKFKKNLKKGCIFICNSDLIENELNLQGLKEVKLPLNRIALDCGNLKVANTIVLGLILSLKPGLLKKKTIIKVLKETFLQKDTLNQNLKALDKGENLCSGKGGKKC